MIKSVKFYKKHQHQHQHQQYMLYLCVIIRDLLIFS